MRGKSKKFATADRTALHRTLTGTAPHSHWQLVAMSDEPDLVLSDSGDEMVPTRGTKRSKRASPPAEPRSPDLTAIRKVVGQLPALNMAKANSVLAVKSAINLIGEISAKAQVLEGAAAEKMKRRLAWHIDEWRDAEDTLLQDVTRVNQNQSLVAHLTASRQKKQAKLEKVNLDSQKEYEEGKFLPCPICTVLDFVCAQSKYDSFVSQMPWLAGSRSPDVQE